MKKTILLLLAAVLCLGLCLLLTGCFGSGASDLPTLRDLSWEGTELTVTLGANKSTGCEWTVDIADDSVIDYSINRKFTLVGNSAGEAVGRSAIGFEGQGEGTTTITLTTPNGWDGSGEGYTYTVTVTVNADGTIQNATGE